MLTFRGSPQGFPPLVAAGPFDGWDTSVWCGLAYARGCMRYGRNRRTEGQVMEIGWKKEFIDCVCDADSHGMMIDGWRGLMGVIAGQL